MIDIVSLVAGFIMGVVIPAVITYLDKDKDGKISEEELKALIEKILEE